MCIRDRTDIVSWRVNGRVLGVEIFPINVTFASISLPGGGTVYTLTIGGLIEHNETTIQCSAVFDEESLREVTPPVTFLIQGQLYLW